MPGLVMHYLVFSWGRARIISCRLHVGLIGISLIIRLRVEKVTTGIKFFYRAGDSVKKFISKSIPVMAAYLYDN